MDAIRAFIAIGLPPDLRTKLGDIVQQLQERCFESGGESARKAVRWVQPDNIHLTLKFLGEVSVANIQALSGMMKVEVLRYQPFSIRINGIGTFPNIRRPRVIWAGSEAPPALAALQHAIEVETRALGYPTEEREFSPHLTLGRVSQNASPAEITAISKAISGMKVGSIGTVYVNQIHLIRSDLHPGGAIYTPLINFPLKNASPQP